MDLDPVASPERKRKHKDRDQHSSKKRKHNENLIEESPSIKRKEKHRKHKHGKDEAGLIEIVAPSPQLQDEPAQSKKKKKKEKKRDKASKPQDRVERSASIEKLPAEASSTRKPLSKPTGSQLASLSAETNGSSSPFHLVTTSLYLPLSPISISATHALPSLLSEHISPLLLTYYPPVRGIILAYSNASLSSTPPTIASRSSQDSSNSSANPQPLTPALTAGEYGVLFVYLKITFLVFRPERSQTFEGWINVQSESFLGAVVYNLFSVGIERRRLPADWKWIAPGQGQPQQEEQQQGQDTGDDDSSVDSDKENFRPLPASASSGGLLQPDVPVDEDDELASGYFQTASGKRVQGTVRFRLRDLDVIPGSEKDKGFISLEGTMLSPEEEQKLVESEKRRAEGLSDGERMSEPPTAAGALSVSSLPKPGGEKQKQKKKSKAGAF
jgi:DNA-directed RNA polymerase I subunit RPA43